jgi:SAM-dependent methyltransferase
MRNPWLDIPESDYIGHMTSPEVDQYTVLGRLLREVLERVRPRDLLLLGCSTGNGLEQVDATVTQRVTGVDINPAYLRRLVERFPSPDFTLTLHCVDLADYAFEPAAYDLVHAGLLFEYLEWPQLLPRLARTLRQGGTLSVVLQLLSNTSSAVTQTAFASLRQLEPLFRFVDPEALVALGRTAGLELETRRVEPLKSGKAFAVLYLRRGAV